MKKSFLTGVCLISALMILAFASIAASAQTADESLNELFAAELSFSATETGIEGTLLDEYVSQQAVFTEKTDSSNEESLMNILADGLKEESESRYSASAKASIFSNGFEDSTGEGISGFNSSVWTALYGTDGDEAYIQTAMKHSGTYAARLEEGDEGDVELITASGAINLEGKENCTLSFWMRQESVEGGEYCYIDIYNGTWQNSVLSFTDTENEGSWNEEEISLGVFNPGSNFRLRFRVEYGQDNDYLVVDDIEISCNEGADTTPPGKATKLDSAFVSQEWIYWNWTNPSDADFSHAIVYIDGDWKANTTLNYYNATGLEPFTNCKIDVYTADTSGNVNPSSSTKTKRTAKSEINVSATVSDPDNKVVNTTIIISDENGTVSYNETGDYHELNILQGIYNIQVQPASHPVKSISIKNAELVEENSNIVLLDIPPNLKGTKNYVINPLINFTNATIVSVAEDIYLYKCASWNFTARECPDGWEKLMNLTIGEEYSFTITPGDPAYSENGSVPVINSISDSPDPVNQSKNIVITANVTDEYKVSKVWVKISGTNYTMQKINANVSKLFTDGFERATLGANWTTSGAGAAWTTTQWEGGPYQGSYSAYTENTGGESIVTSSRSTANYENVTFSFYALTTGMDTGEYIAADWYNGTAWVNLLNTQTIAAYTLYSYPLGTASRNNANFQVRFRCSSNANNERCHVDNVNITARKIYPIYRYAYNTSNLIGGLHYYTVYANDTGGNNAAPKTGNFTVKEYIKPSVFGLIPVAGTSYQTNITIQIAANATDFSGISKVIAMIDYPNSTKYNLTLTNAAGAKYNASFTIPMLAGRYNITIFANDTGNNINNTQKTYFTATGNADLNPTSNSPADQQVELGSIASIPWILYDDVSPGYYYVKRNGTLFYGPEAWTNGSILNIKPNTFFLGSWAYTIYYNDSYGNNGTSDTVIITVVDNITANCSDLPFADSGAPLLKSITVNGEMSDWDSVLEDPANVMTDLSTIAGDLDIVGTADRDITLFSYTWNESHLFTLWNRVATGKNIASMLMYIDYGNDGYMNSTDKVLKFTWSGSNRQYDADIYNYIPAGGTPDLMNGSGYDMPGSITNNKSISTGILGGAISGIALETMVKWSDIFLSGPEPLTIQPGSALSTGTNLPSQLEDNINVVQTNYPALLFRPATTSKSAQNGTSAYYLHELVGCGLTHDTFDLANTSTQGWAITYYYPNGTLVSDTNSDGKPDVHLDYNDYTALIAKIDVPGSTLFGTTDTTTITATSEFRPSYYRQVQDITTVGDITITPNQIITCGVNGSNSSFSYTVSNFQGFADTIEISGTSSYGWNVLLYDENMTIYTDTDGDSHIDLGNMSAGSEKTVNVILQIPAAASRGTNDTVTMRINSSVSPSMTATATGKATVSKRVEIYPDYNVSVGVLSGTFFELNVKNCQCKPDTIDITYWARVGWNTTFYQTDKTNLLLDTDFDSVQDVGNLSSCGGTYKMYAKIVAPPNPPSNDTILVYANTSRMPMAYDTSTINLFAQKVTTYSNAARTTPSAVFEVKSTVYAKASGLESINNVYFVWVDPDSVIKRVSPDLPVSSQDEADDALATNISLVLGNWTIIVYDAQNDDELGRNIFLLRDTQKPKITLNEPPLNYKTRNGTIKFNWTATDNYDMNLSCNLTINSMVYASNVSSPNGTKTSYTVSGLADGYYRWNVTCIDDSRNKNTSITRNFTVDHTNPKLYLASPVNYYNTSLTSVNFTWNATDNVDPWLSCNLSIDGKVNVSNIASQNSKLKTQAVSGFIEGLHNWSVVCWDDLNNKNYSQTRYFTVDNTKPNVVLNYPPNQFNTTLSTINFNWTATDNLDPVLKCNLTINGTVYAANRNSPSGVPTNYTVTGIADGTYYWNVTCADDSGNKNTSITRIFTRDTKAPQIQFVYPTTETGNYSQSWIYTNVTAYDKNLKNITTYLYNTTGLVSAQSSTASPLQHNFTSLPEGKYYINATAYDYTGNKNSTETRVIILDRTKPSVVLNYPPNNYNSSSGTINFNWTAYDNMDAILVCNLTINGTVYASNINSPNATPVNYTVSGLSDGHYSWNVTCIDNANNKNTSETRTFTVDSVKPSVALNWPPNSYNTSSTSINFNWTATNGIDPVLDCNLTIDGVVNKSNIASPAGAPTNYTVSGFAQGYHSWNVTCRDDSGNYNTSETRTFLVDYTAPSIALNYPPNYFNTSSSSINFNWTAADNYDALLRCNLTINGTVYASNRNSPSGTPTNYTVSSLVDGTYYWNVTCADDSGNYNTSETRIFTKDTTKPNVVLNAPINNYNTSSAAISFNWTAYDNLDPVLKCNLTINGTVYASNINSPTGIATNYTVTGLADGVYTWNVTCADNLGNYNTSETRIFTKDTTNPTVILNSPAANYYENISTASKLMAFNCSATDNIALKNISLYLTNSSNQSFMFNSTSALSGTSDSAQWQISLKPGNYTWNCIAYDRLGNYDWGVNRTIRIRYVPMVNPYVDLLAPANNSYDSNGQVTFKYNVTNTYPISNCTLYLNGTAYMTDFSVTRNISESLQITNLGEGVWNWVISCTNNMGSTGNSSSGVIIVQFPYNWTNATLIINETIMNADGQPISAVIELIDSRSGEIDTNTTSGTLQNITSGTYDIVIKPSILNITSIILANVSVTANITDIIDIDNFTTSEYSFANTFAISPLIDDYDFINITRQAETGDIFICDEWNFTNQSCTGEWLKTGNYNPGDNYSIAYYGNGSFAFVESNYTINLLNQNNFLIRNSQTETSQAGSIVDVLLVPVDSSVFRNITVTAHNTLSVSNDLKIDIIPNRTGFVQSYLIDPAALNFINATLYKNASNRSVSVWKCLNYSYEEEACMEDLIFVSSIASNSDYMIFFNATDPVFIEQPGPLDGKDSYINEQAPTTNYGNADEFRLDNRNARTQRAIIEWNLSGIPSGVQITSAVMGMYLHTQTGGAMSTQAVRVNQTWAEATVTWNNRPTFDATAYDTVSVSTIGWNYWNITSLAASWYNGTFANQGLYIKPATEQAGTTNLLKRFYSSDYITDITLRPKLNITWMDITPPNVTLNYPPANFVNTTSGQNINFNCSATDNVNLTNISLYITNSQNLSFSLNQTSSITGTANESTWTVYLGAGNYTWNCKAYDTQGLYDWGINRTIKLTPMMDNTPPSVIITSPLNDTLFNQSSNISIKANVTDDYGVSTVFANVTWDSAYETITLSYNGTSGLWEGVFTNTTFIGFYNITIWANDTSSNINNTEYVSVRVGKYKIKGYITNSNYSNVPSAVYLYNLSGALLAQDNEVYEFFMDQGKMYNLRVVPSAGSLKELYFFNATVSADVINFTRLEDTNNSIASRPYYDFNWTELVSWLPHPNLEFSYVRLNMTYGAGSNLSLFKCAAWDFDSQNCTNPQNWTVISQIADGPSYILYNFTKGDPAVGAGPGDQIPTTTLNYPPDNYVNSTASPANVTFNCSASDTTGTNKGIVNISLYITNSNNASFSLNQTYYSPTNGTTLTGIFSLLLGTGNYTWNCIAYDLGGNYDWADQNRTLKVNYTSMDNTAPSVILVSPTPGQNFNQTNYVLIAVNATDDYAVDTVLANVTWDSTYQQIALVYNSGTGLYEANFTNTTYVVSIPERYNISIFANDTSGNVNNSITGYFYVNDITPPYISIIQPANNSNYALNQNVSISVNVTDYYYDNVNAVYANITWSGGTQTISLTETGNTQIFTGTFTNTTAFGIYNITVFANDTSSNSNTKKGYFNVIQATVIISGITCSLTESPQVVESGEKILFQGDFSYSDGKPAAQANVSQANITIYRVNSTNTTIVHTSTMAFLQSGIWYYNWDAGAYENANYMAVANVKTNAVPPGYASCSALFTISGRGVFKVLGISPDLTNVNQTVKLGVEVTFNGEDVDSSKITNPELWVAKVNGSTQHYNSSTGLSVADGLIYLDGQFNETGVYYLNWSFTYYNRTKTAKEIVVAKDWDEKLSNLSMNSEVYQLVLENKQRLIEVLKEMEQQQEFSEEEIFLVTDAVNSMSRVANLLAEGQISDQDAMDEMSRINSNLKGGGSRLTGRLAGVLDEEDDEFGVLAMLMIAAIVILIVAIAVRTRSAGRKKASAGGKERNTPRRFELAASWVSRKIAGIRNKNRQKQFSHEKNVPLTRFFEKKASSERQKTLVEGIASEAARVQNKIRQNSYAPRRERRYRAIIRKMLSAAEEKRMARINRLNDAKQNAVEKELNFRKAVPEDFLAVPRDLETAKKARILILIASFKKKLHENMMRRNAMKNVHSEKVRENGRTITKMKASELFSAIDSYKTQEDTCKGMISNAKDYSIADDYEKGSRYSSVEESRAVVGIRNTINAISETETAKSIMEKARQIPKPSIRMITRRLPRIRMPDVNAGAAIEGIKAAAADRAQKGIENARSAVSKAADAVRSSRLLNKEEDSSLGIEFDEKGMKKHVPKPAAAKPRPGKNSKRRYQSIISSIKRNYLPKKENGMIELLKDAAEKENVEERLDVIEGRKELLENDKIKYFAWNWGRKKSMPSSVIRKAYPSEKDAEAFQSTDSEIDAVANDKKQAMQKLKDIYTKSE